MTEMRRLDIAGGVAGLRAAGDQARGFLGTDPVTQNDALLGSELTRIGAQVYGHGDTLLGYLPNVDQPRQAYLASTSSDPDALRLFTAFLGTYQRCTSYVATVPADSVAVGAFDACGFRRIGMLRDHQYRSGRYHDVVMFFATGEDVCRS
ncbi:MAG TPA: GNAT family protein [Micromonosporaceae bacterium]